MIYKIYDKGRDLFSNGIVRPSWRSGDKSHEVIFNKHGKEWTDEKLLKKHILKVFTKSKWGKNWEIIEVKYIPTKPIDEWIDPVMMLEILKKTK